MSSAPEVKHSAGNFRVLFADERINFRVERVYDEKQRGVSGEVTVMTTHAHLEPDIHRSRVNLLSTVSQNSFIKRCKEHSPALESLDWTRMLERVCREVVDLHRQGEPTISLAAHTKDESARFRIDPLIPDRRASLFYATGGVGKTLLVANYLGTLVAAGIQQNGFSVEPGNVLIYDYETDVDESQERCRAVAKGLGIDLPSNLYYRRAIQGLASDIEQLQREVMDKEIALVIIDSAGPACGGEPESAEATNKYFAALRSLNVATATIAHVSKAESGHPFGSVYWTNLPRRTYRITSTQAAGDTEYTLGIVNTKANWGQRLTPIGLRVSFGTDAVTFDRAEVKDVPELDAERSLRLRLKDLLKSNGAMDTATMSEHLDVDAGQIRARLSEWNNKDFVIINPGVPGVVPMWGVIAIANS
jgi:hypothetical protein|tara:strand:+ start:1945 stop:3198 length:1254 start_codon:yes stop_codon:yes gene_type:complete